MIDPRPFYVIAHNPNSIPQVLAALDAGANAIEPDINVYHDRPSELCVAEASILDPDEGGPASAPSLTQYLTELHAIAIQRPELSLVVLDCKPRTVTAELGEALLQKVRTLLTYDTRINVIFSVASLKETAIVETIKSQLGPREAVMIDQENDPIAVSGFFSGAGIENQAYGNGISATPVLGPNVRPSLEKACWFRATTNRLRFIYAWTVNDHHLMREYIRIGVDGIITDHPGDLRAIVKEAEFAPLVRYATRADNAFLPANQTYGLAVHTGDQPGAGTDAKVTFTLTGAGGSASIAVDTSLPGRMEAGAWNYITLPSADLGALHSITVQRDSQGDGPNWFLDKITVETFRGVMVQAVFDSLIGGNQPFTQPLAAIGPGLLSVKAITS
jgi:glycerophosphoryl diester phosphodiesterase